MTPGIFNDGAFEFIRAFLIGVEWFFTAYLVCYSTFLFISVIIGSMALYQKRQQEIFKNVLLKDHFIPISIIVPARNEEVTVTETVRSLLALEYPLFEIIVVDDGSVDGTAARLIETFGMQAIRRPVQRKVPCRPAEEIYEANAHGVLLTLIRKKNGGKADALNLGINACRYPYFICMDADSVLQYDSLSRIVKPVLEDENIVAVGGTVRPANNVTLEGGRVSRYRLPRNPLACMQVLEYARSFLASRILFDKFNGSLIISGAFGLFKKDAVVAVGGYDAATVGEDMELVVKLHDYCISNGLPYRMRYATDAICWSQVPEHLKDLCRQRRRWHLGLFQSMWKHRVMLGNPKFGAVSFISCFYYLFYELLSPFIEIFGIAAAVLAALAGLLDLPFMLLFFCAYAGFASVLTMTAFFARTQTIDLKIDPADALKAAVLSVAELTVLRFVLVWVRATAFIGYRKKKLRWDKTERKKIDLK